MGAPRYLPVPWVPTNSWTARLPNQRRAVFVSKDEPRPYTSSYNRATHTGWVAVGGIEPPVTIALLSGDLIAKAIYVSAFPQT